MNTREAYAAYFIVRYVIATRVPTATPQIPHTLTRAMEINMFNAASVMASLLVCLKCPAASVKF